MKKRRVKKTYEEINEKIRQGQVVVVTAEEMIDIVDRHGEERGSTKGGYRHNGDIQSHVFFRRLY